MKFRKGFVSNSSSSSFSISISDITAMQLQMIRAHVDISEALGEHVTDPWYIYIEGDDLIGNTYMDNFDMRKFLTNVVGVQEDSIKWG